MQPDVTVEQTAQLASLVQGWAASNSDEPRIEPRTEPRRPLADVDVVLAVPKHAVDELRQLARGREDPTAWPL
jgi:hypothetical protein